MRDSATELSVVVPVFNNEGTIGLLCTKLHEVLHALPGLAAFEIILVDDGSQDGSWSLIESTAAQYPNVRGAKLSRNFGQQSAIAAGLSVCSGDWTLVMDCDLQDRPDDIAVLWEKTATGDYDLVCARRVQRQHSPWRIAGSKLLFFLFNTLSDMKYDPAVANFRIMSRRVVDSYLSMPETVRSLGAQVQWLGFRTGYVDVQHSARHEGKSSYSFGRLLSLAIDTIVSYSNKPLRLSIALGVLICILTAVVIGVVFVRWLMGDIAVGGWTSLILSLWFLAGVIITNLGVLGLYIGKVYDETKSRPTFVFSRFVNLEEPVVRRLRRRSQLIESVGENTAPDSTKVAHR